MSEASPLEKLSAPPVIEVICGVFFEEVSGLDPVLAGAYWNERKDEYPGHEIRTAAGRVRFVLGQGVPPLRTWLVSPDDGAFVIQLQADRFYMNWRLRGGDYPRFSTERGMLNRTLQEFQRFSTFCEGMLGAVPQPNAIELGKIDRLIHGRHWSDKADLAKMLPTLQATLQATETDAPEVEMRFGEEREGHRLQVALSSLPKGGGTSGRDLRLETTVVRPTEPGRDRVQGAFEVANREVNSVFATLIPKAERKRFQSTEGS